MARLPKILPEVACAFIGLEPESLPWGRDEDHPECESFKAELYTKLSDAYHRGYRQFLTGLSQGTDMLCADILVAMRRDPQYRGLRVIAVLPSKDRAAYWDKASRTRYQVLKNYCDAKFALMETRTEDSEYQRDRYALEHVSLLISAWDGRMHTPTAKAVVYAQTLGMPIEWIQIGSENQENFRFVGGGIVM